MPPVRAKRVNNKIDDPTRQKILHAVVEQGQTYAEVAFRFGFPYSTVRSIILAERETLLPRGGNRYRRLQPDHIQWLIDAINTRPDRTIQSLKQNLNDHFQINPPISHSAIRRAISKEVGYTLKLLRPEPDQYNDPDRIEARQEWVQEVHRTHRRMDSFIFLDESGFNLHIYRQFGRAPRGVRPFRVVPAQRGVNMSLLVAVGETGLVASEIRVGSYNSNRFTEFLRTRLFPQIEGQRCVLLDNARIHKTAQVREAVAEVGHILLFLPPYSPHLNAAESLFSCVKSHVKKQEVRRETLSGHILGGLNQVSREKAADWIREVDRNFMLSISGQALGRLYNNHRAPVDIDVEDPYEEREDEEVEVEEEEVEVVEEEEDEEEEDDEEEEEDEEVEEDEEEEDEEAGGEQEAKNEHELPYVNNEVEERLIWEYDDDLEGPNPVPIPAPAPAKSRYSPRRTRAGTTLMRRK